MFRRNIICLLSILICFSGLFFACNGEEYKICPKCGENIQNNTNFCPNCGFQIKYDDSGNIIEEDNANNESISTEPDKEIVVKELSASTIFNYINLSITLIEQTPTLLNPDSLVKYHLTTKFSIAAYPCSNNYCFNNAYFYFRYGQSNVRVDLNEQGNGSNILVISEMTANPTKTYQFYTDKCVNIVVGTVSYYE